MTSTVETRQFEPKHDFDERLVKLAASSLAENLREACPPATDDNDVTPDPHLTEKLMKQLSFDIQRRKSLLEDSRKACRLVVAEDMEDHTASTADDSFSDGELLRRVREEGFLQWKQQQASSSLPDLQNTASKKSSQMSLFLNQFNAGGSALQSFMSWHRIQEESQGDPAVQLQMLKSVQHLRDILPDWEGSVKSFFLQGLLQSQQQQQQDDFVGLHRQWFDQSRHSTEFRTLQIDLCQNLVTAMQRMTTASTTKNHLNAMMDLALDMFEDWMLRGIYVQDDRVWAIGRTLWNWLTVAAGANDPTATAAAQAMIQVDGEATWFSSWSAHLSPDQCLELVEGNDSSSSDGGLSQAIAWCHSYFEQEGESNKTSEDEAKCFFWLSIMHSVLESTRVSRFPWQLVESHTSAAATDKDKKLFIFHLFLRFFKENDGNINKMNMSCDALETILLGTQQDEAFECMLTSATALRDSTNKNHVQHHLLHRTVLRHERAL